MSLALGRPGQSRRITEGADMLEVSDLGFGVRHVRAAASGYLALPERPTRRAAPYHNRTFWSTGTEHGQIF